MNKDKKKCSTIDSLSKSISNNTSNWYRKLKCRYLQKKYFNGTLFYKIWSKIIEHSLKCLQYTIYIHTLLSKYVKTYHVTNLSGTVSGRQIQFSKLCWPFDLLSQLFIRLSSTCARATVILSIV